MMNQMQKSVCTLALLAATALPAVASTTDMRVAGVIFPSACSATLSNGATVNYGTINPDMLSETGYTVMDEKEVDFTINCAAPSKIAITAVSGRAGSTADSAQNSGQNAGLSPASALGRSANAVGLGLDGTTKIGGYATHFKTNSFRADGSAVTSITRSGSHAAWSSAAQNSLYSKGANPLYMSWAASGTTTPVAFTTLSGKLAVQAYLNKTSELDLSKPIDLNGLTTIELIYL